MSAVRRKVPASPGLSSDDVARIMRPVHARIAELEARVSKLEAEKAAKG
jgi:hypothetical protein